MKSRRPDSQQPLSVGAAVNGYQRLTVDEVMVDLPCLDSDQLRFVQSLEQIGGRRRRVLDRIAQLLVALGEPALPALDIRPARPSGHRSRRAAQLVAVLVILVVASAGAIAVSRRHGPTASVATSPADAAATMSADAPAPGDIGTDALERLMPAGLPAGYGQETDVAADTGPVDLTRAVRHDGSPDARSSLTKAGFVHGLSRTWQTGDHHEINISIYQFKDPAGAGAYGQHRIGTARSNPGATTTGVRVAGIPGAVGLTALAGDTTSVRVSFAKAGYFVQLSVNWYLATGLESTAQQLARDQYGRL